MSDKTTVQTVSSDEDYKSCTESIPSSALTVLYFHAPWAEPCKQMSTVLEALASTYPSASPPKIAFLSINAEDLPDISEEHDVTAVPYIVLRKDNSTVETISGSDAQKLRAAVEKHAGAGTSSSSNGLPPPQQVTRPEQQPISSASMNAAADPGQIKTSGGANNTAKTFSQYAPDGADPATGPEYSSKKTPELGTENKPSDTSADDLEARLSQLTNAAPCMLFMKGTPSAPQCGFSRQLVALLRENNVRYGFFNILADDEVRQGLKEFSDWPTFPQLYLKGELVGGLDIVKEELESDPSYFEEFAAKKASQGGMAGAEEQKAEV
jgi:Grx4 family monothiol glutaredoxin